ncbi:response regulator transcription factor [Xanthomonadaceae bacterium JHOS43]|nr:response regulator transcription factor [Xanthomonadaceae bacterium JHOS43]MCX7564566.1 response regulator transcription factor [Xanthomonadaceae bacterium XH05]
MQDTIQAFTRAIPAHVVLVEDDDELRDAILTPGLADFGFDVCGVASAEGLYRHILGSPCDLVVLDVGLPNEDGFSAAAHLRRTLGMKVGIVMLTGRIGDDDRVRALKDGADVYLAKPVEVEVLAATLHSLLRRMRAGISSETVAVGASAAPEWRLESDGWCLRSPKGGSVALTLAERRVMSPLMEHGGKPVEREVLLQVLAEGLDNFDPHRLDMIVHRLRRKVEKRIGEALPLHSVRGSGYVLAHRV